MTNSNLNDLKQRYVAAGAASTATHFADRAENAEVWDADGKRYIDFGGGIGVNNWGQSNVCLVSFPELYSDPIYSREQIGSLPPFPRTNLRYLL